MPPLLQQLTQALGYTPLELDMQALLKTDKQKHTNWAERLQLVMDKIRLATDEINSTGKVTIAKPRLEKALAELQRIREELT